MAGVRAGLYSIFLSASVSSRVKQIHSTNQPKDPLLVPPQILSNSKLLNACEENPKVWLWAFTERRNNNAKYSRISSYVWCPQRTARKSAKYRAAELTATTSQDTAQSTATEGTGMEIPRVGRSDPKNTSGRRNWSLSWSTGTGPILAFRGASSSSMSGSLGQISFIQMPI